MNQTDLCFQPIHELAPQLRSGAVSPVEVAEAYLARIEQLQPTLNAYITVTAEAARKQAREAEAAIRSGDYRGPLHGVPIALKDIIATRGVRTTAGSKILADWVPSEDATVVERLHSAGAVMLGKLNTHEFA
ncbi:MAG: amidase, partial [Chloroflexi bacterium]|nr:amidase [Chloroflexota bacterium]